MTSPTSRPGSRTSDFARALKALLDDTRFYDRGQWSLLLSVTTSALSQWVNDRTLPRAELLAMIVDLLRTRGGEAARLPLEGFDALLRRPAAEISPHGARMGATLGEYLSKTGSLLDYARSLRGLSGDEQKEAVEGGAWPASAPHSGPAAYPALTIPSIGKDMVDRYVPANSNDLFWPITRFVRDGAGGGRSTVNLIDLSKTPRAVIQGGPGSGKSTTLMQLQQMLERREVPVARLSLRTCSPPELDRWLNDNAAGDRVALLDGLDEMAPDHRVEAAAMIAGAFERAPTMRAVLASRPVPELDRLSTFERFSIAPLTDVDLVAALTGAALRADQLAPPELDRFLCHLAERDDLRQPMRDRLFLRKAWSLFEESAVTPFWEAEIIRECATMMLEWDQKKGLNRVREPWASPHQLSNLLGELSYRSLERDTDCFDHDDLVAWTRERANGASADRILDLLRIKGLITNDHRSYRFTYQAMRDYFAAQYAVESADSATRYLDAWRTQPKLRDPLRIACSIANDATPLLRSVLDSAGQAADTYLLVADILAQPLSIDRDILDEGCSSLVSWLSRQTADWARFIDGAREKEAGSAWALAMETDSDPRAQGAISKALRAVHRARSGPARGPLKAHMTRSDSIFLPAFADALDIEGRLNVSFDAMRTANAPHAATAVRMAIDGPQLV